MQQLAFLKIQSATLLVFILCVGVFQPIDGNPIQKTIINGWVTNFDDPFDLPAIELINYMPFIREWNTYSCFIEQDGVFRFEFEQLYPKEIMIKFREMFSVFAYPGDSIYLTIDAMMLSDTSNTRNFEYNYIKVNCPNQKFQDEYLEFTVAFSSAFQTYDDFSAGRKAQKNLDHSAYSDHVKDQSARYYTYLDEYIITNKPSKAFQEWATNWLYAKELDDLLRYGWLHPHLNELDETTFQLPEEYYGFLKDERHNDEKLLTSHQYFGFLHELYMHLIREFHQSDLHNQYDTLYETGNETEAYRLLLNYIIENTNGFEQEYFVSRFFSRLIYWKFLDRYDALYDPSLVGREDYNQVLAKEYADLQKLISEPVFAKDLYLHHSSISEEDVVFNTLPDKYPDRVIYIDFWAPWCGPCIAEMPHSKELQEKMKGKDVVFVFLASHCTEESWKATISQRQLSGEHYLLNDNEYSTLADKFDIAGIPRYMIIDKKGMVINDNAPRPSEDSLVGLLESLSKR